MCELERCFRTSKIFFFLSLSPLCQGTLFQYSICIRLFILFWMFEILSKCSFSFGSRTVEIALFLVCFTSVLYCDKVLSPVKFDFVPLNSPIVILNE